MYTCTERESFVHFEQDFLNEGLPHWWIMKSIYKVANSIFLSERE